MNYEEMKTKYFNKKFLILYFMIFIILYIVCSFIKFIGQLPILIIITFLITYYIIYKSGSKLINSVITDS